MKKINIYFENIPSIKLPKRKVTDFVREISKAEDFLYGEINFIFCNDYYLLQINKQFLKHDFYTDIITFDYTKDKKISGDIYLSFERMEENANIFRNSIMDEILRVMIHGILHLIGYKDNTKIEKKLMKEMEDVYLEIFKAKP
jgi:probable rRNA maturation factor